MLCNALCKDSIIENPLDKTYSQKIARSWFPEKGREDEYGNKQKNPKGNEKQTDEMERANYFDMERSPLIGNTSLVVFEDGEQVTISTEGEDVRFLLISGKPIGEPVAWCGPIVMNTQEELQIASDEYQKGTFIKHRG